MDRFLSIEAFVDVAETRSFAETARRMRLSKSVITTRIQQLEEYVGAPLFHRNTRSVQLPTSDELISRPVFRVRRVFCASPQYLQRHPVPLNPRELYGHSLGLYSGYPSRDRWIFDGHGEQVALDLRPALRSNSVHLLKEFGCEHAGIVCLPTLVASDAILSGQLQLVLPDWQLSSFPFSVVYPRTSRGGLKLKLFIESLIGKFAGEPPWDRALIAKGLLPHMAAE